MLWDFFFTKMMTLLCIKVINAVDSEMLSCGYQNVKLYMFVCLFFLSDCTELAKNEMNLYTTKVHEYISNCLKCPNFDFSQNMQVLLLDFSHHLMMLVLPVETGTVGGFLQLSHLSVGRVTLNERLFEPKHMEQCFPGPSRKYNFFLLK